MGLPRFFGRVHGPDASDYEVDTDTAGAEPLMGPDTGDATGGTKRDDDASQGRTGGPSLLAQNMGPQEIGLVWTLAYYVLLVVGAYGFYRYFWVLTESKNALVEFE